MKAVMGTTEYTRYRRSHETWQAVLRAEAKRAKKKALLNRRLAIIEAKVALAALEIDLGRAANLVFGPPAV